eukprot:XP_001691550.1 predicted protein [Chlamydomonas reinhardtii]
MKTFQRIEMRSVQESTSLRYNPIEVELQEPHPVATCNGNPSSRTYVATWCSIPVHLHVLTFVKRPNPIAPLPGPNSPHPTVAAALDAPPPVQANMVTQPDMIAIATEVETALVQLIAEPSPQVLPVLACAKVTCRAHITSPGDDHVTQRILAEVHVATPRVPGLVPLSQWLQERWPACRVEEEAPAAAGQALAQAPSHGQGQGAAQGQAHIQRGLSSTASHAARAESPPQSVGKAAPQPRPKTVQLQVTPPPPDIQALLKRPQRSRGRGNRHGREQAPAQPQLASTPEGQAQEQPQDAAAGHAVVQRAGADTKQLQQRGEALAGAVAADDSGAGAIPRQASTAESVATPTAHATASKPALSAAAAIPAGAGGPLSPTLQLTQVAQGSGPASSGGRGSVGSNGAAKPAASLHRPAMMESLADPAMAAFLDSGSTDPKSRQTLAQRDKGGNVQFSGFLSGPGPGDGSYTYGAGLNSNMGGNRRFRLAAALLMGHDASGAASSMYGVSPSCDVYSVGLLMWHLVTGQVPFDHLTTQEVVRAKEMGSLDEQLPFSPELPLAYIALARRCWSTAPMQRPAMRSVLAELRSLRCQLLGQSQPYESPSSGFGFGFGLGLGRSSSVGDFTGDSRLSFTLSLALSSRDFSGDEYALARPPLELAFGAGVSARSEHAVPLALAASSNAGCAGAGITVGTLGAETRRGGAVAGGDGGGGGSDASGESSLAAQPAAASAGSNVVAVAH